MFRGKRSREKKASLGKTSIDPLMKLAEKIKHDRAAKRQAC
jgi:hypothetical protein